MYMYPEKKGGQGCTKLKSAWGLNFNINFRPDFHAIFMLSGKAQNVHFILSNSYIGLKMRTVFFFNHTEMNKKLSFDDYYEQWLLLIAKGTRQNNLITESWKKGKKSRILIEKEISSYKQLMLNLVCCNSCRKVGSHICVCSFIWHFNYLPFKEAYLYCKRNSHKSSRYQLPLSATDLSHYISHHANCTSKLLKTVL